MVITIIGAGPGGYETAVAAAARGIEVNIVSAGPVGGTCLNEGCIPTKALCRNAEVMRELHNASRFGISADGLSFSIGAAMQHKDEVVSQLRGGVEFLLKNKLIHLVYGMASFKDRHTVAVKAEDGSVLELVSDYIIIATGSQSATLPVPGNAGAIAFTVGALYLRWLFQTDVIIIPKSTHKERMAENLDILDFELPPEDIQKITSLDMKQSLFMDHHSGEATKQFMGWRSMVKPAE